MKELKYGLQGRSGEINTNFRVGEYPEFEIKLTFDFRAFDPDEQDVGEDIRKLIDEIEGVVNRFTSQIKE